MYYTQAERLNIVVDIATKLKNFKTKNGQVVNLYSDNLCSFITDFKQICNSYVKQDEAKLVDFRGTLEFEEIDRTIEYVLPVKKQDEPLFVIRAKMNK
ncbi:MAG: hypothetical protein EB127_25490 [Alphaproteobacteria bacterium]|nr:hypothetical protein [Alphaproteobacteria bacterium]